MNAKTPCWCIKWWSTLQHRQQRSCTWSKLKAVYANTDTMQALAAKRKLCLTVWRPKAAQLEQLLGSDAPVNAMLATEQAKLDSLTRWAGLGDSVVKKAGANCPGLRMISVPQFLQGFKDKATPFADSFDALKRRSSKRQRVWRSTVSRESAAEAKNANTNYRQARQFRPDDTL